MMYCQVSEDHLSAFVAYIALGTLEAIRAGTVSPGVGIWTLGRPTTWEPLQKVKLAPQELIDVLQQGDELSALQKLAPDTFTAVVSGLIEQLHTVLRTMPDPTWWLTWKNAIPDE
jgi:hypothetical protein